MHRHRQSSVSSFSDDSDVDSFYKAQKDKRSSLHGPLRVARLCVLSILVPGLLLSIPLYMRYNVYIQQAYPMGMSDVRIMDKKISTTWCQRQVIWSNATFNAYLLEEEPELQSDTVKVSMTRHLVLEDDMKEYWGFYLLKGSTVKVSTCARWPGASLIMIRGHRHLKQCAYIGDDSSEELDEIFDGDENNNTSADYDTSNSPAKLKRIADGVVITEDKDISSNHSYNKLFHHSTAEQQLGISRKGQVHLTFAEQEINPKKSRDKEEYKTNAKIVDIKTHPESTAPKVQTSKEIYDGILRQLKNMGPKGKTMLKQLNEMLDHEGNKYNLENIPKTSSHEVNPAKEKHLRNKKRKRRQTSANMKIVIDLAEHDEQANHAAEELDLQPDGEADHHGRINETTPNDQSNSEFWSSFSSSEERLMECEGLLLNLPLTPHHICEAHRSESLLARASLPNTVSYKVPSNGYYFFVFNSENEVQPNFLRIHFKLEKTTYNVSNAVGSCRNQTGSCSFPLRFWSEDRVILELPVKANDTLWNEEFLAVSTCEPRTAIYIVCVLAVPLLIILFAFQ